MFYPGCSSEPKASASNYMTSIDAMCRHLDIQLNEIPDWNCCSASVAHAGGGEIQRLALNARNMALAEQEHADQDVVATCAGCWLATRETKQRLSEDDELMAATNEALAEAGLQYKAKQAIRHMAEVLVEDFGFDELAKPVVKPLEGLKIAGYVGCQTNRPFGIAGESYENPQYLDKMVEAMGAESIPTYEKKVQCCGGAQAFSEPEKSQEMIKGIVEAAYDNGADMVVTPCPVCQLNVEIYQDQINARHGTKFKMPVLYYSQLMSVAYGDNVKQAGLDGQVIRAKQLEDIANR